MTTTVPQQAPQRPVALAPPLPTVADKPKVTDTEPVALTGAIQGVLIALLAVLQGFDITHWSQEQIALLLALYVALSAALTAFARAKVWSPASVARLVGRRQ